MAQICKLVHQTQIRSSPDRFFDLYKNKPSLMTKVNPEIFRSIEVLEGDGKSVGSVRLWNYLFGGPVIAKDKIDTIDEKNNLITFKLMGGEVTKRYKSFKATLHAFSEDGKNMVKWTLDYEKENEDIPTPRSQIDFLVSCTKEVDAFLLKA